MLLQLMQGQNTKKKICQTNYHNIMKNEICFFYITRIKIHWKKITIKYFMICRQEFFQKNRKSFCPEYYRSILTSYRIYQFHIFRFF